MEMNRVYGVLGISSIMANWNADFSGYPKTISDGRTFGSDKAFKYPMKKIWEEQGEKVLYIKSLRLYKDEKKGEQFFIPRTLKERYEQIFAVKDLKDEKDGEQVLENLFQAIDVKNFGATFAEEGNNISITGAVQIGQGFNKYEDSLPQEQQILSPFRDPKAIEKDARKKKGEEEGDEAAQSTLGTKIVSDEAHYFYPFAINPGMYKSFVEMGVTKGYTREDYQAFKKAALTGATAFATNAKLGCENEFGLFVETDQNAYLPSLAEYISFKKGEEMNVIHIKLGFTLKAMGDKIKSVEIYYNPLTTVIEGDLPEAKFYNIVTGQEVKQ